MAASRPTNYDTLENTVNDVLIHIGKTIRAQTKNGRRTVALTSATKIHEANNTFNATLDVIEADIFRAKATLRRDLELLRAQKNTATVAAASKSEPAPSVAVQQAPPAPMDVDLEEPPSTAVKIKTEPRSSSVASSGQAAMAPFPNMELDSPIAVTTALPVIPAAAAAAAAANPPVAKLPIVKKESPPQTMKPVPTPAVNKPVVAGPVGAIKAPAKKSSPVMISKVPSPANPRSTASPAAAKVPSPVLLKSAAVSPVLIKESPQLSPATVNRAISLSSSSSPIMITSPVMTKKAAAISPAVKVAVPGKQAIPQTTAPSQSHATAPALATVTAVPIVPPRAKTEDMNMDALLDFDGPAHSNEQENHDLGFTDMQFTLLQIPVQPPQPPVQDDSEFDVEKFAADAMQDLMSDLSGQPSTARPQPQPQPQPQQQQSTQPRTNELAAGTDAAAATDNGDDLFKFIDGADDLLGEDPTTNFDELYMGGSDSNDIDSYFDS
ncbi:hypothetical protein CMQ_4762 [Grosmannia clavigera kw1407]|uniref:Uncharacterized protein n=1 Tax=Grosmannia clavigera (strain kw1407 / UAMH 11150) TaxID=655863 RepID=F0XUR3_GROCL|nr:uncharacterized protein CMQ_4762 [Grosmannia clavigera kw1407]EFW98910.1 hypothetical protein CMQ_4762 [Grosmannia clavigera kw1407]